jgi:uncharacterized protein (DUF1015 family)
MASISPFAAYRYTAKAGRLQDLVTQPYDKITPEMQARYLARSPYNLVRIILGERFPADNDRDNVYTRAQQYLNDWIRTGILAPDAEPSVYAYSQKFTPPDSDASLVRKGFIALGDVEDYAAGVVHRHEETLAGPKKDRLELLRATRAHFGQIFMLYPDPDLAIERLLDSASASDAAEITDEYGTAHRVSRISDARVTACVQQLMSGKKLLIADGHHRYETALAFRNENPDLPGADKVMMTFVNMHSPGLRILATHRVIRNLPRFEAGELLRETSARELASLDELKQILSRPAPDRLRIGIAFPNTSRAYLIDRQRRTGELDVQTLHAEILADALKIDREAVRNESYLQYVRGIDAAVAALDAPGAQVAFLLEPTTIQQVADVAFSGGVMPQKSTDFYPKLLSGLTVYKVGQ